MIRLNIAIVRLNRVEKLVRLLVSEFVNAIEAVVQQLGYDVLSWLRQGLKRAYSVGHLSCPVAPTYVSGLSTTSIRWKDEGSRNNGK